MKFTNLTRAGMYMQCCHREVAPGESFIVPWLSVKDNRPVRLAMRNGALAWESEDGEPTVPGSAALPSEAERARIADRRKAERKAREAKEADRMNRQRKADDESVKANMARMGNFDVPQVREYGKPKAVRSGDKPVTRADVISGDKPKSLADIVRHNRAVKAFGTSQS